MKEHLFNKCIGFSSGKGGVGKSTTAINVALGLAIQNRKVLVVDLDPFSNISTILDIYGEHKEYDNTLLSSATLSFEDITTYFNDHCHIMLSGWKGLEGGAQHIIQLITKKFHNHIVQNYDYVILDFPAGITSDYIQIFLPRIKHLVVVVQPEPTSHVSSGAFIKTALDANNKLKILIWHNKFKNIVTEKFHSLDVIGNYNRLINKQYAIDAKQKKRCTTLVTVPHDSMLDFLHSVQSPKEYMLSKIHSIVRYIREVLILNYLHDNNIPSSVQQFVYYCVQHYDLKLHKDGYNKELTDVTEIYTRHKLLKKNEVAKIDWPNIQKKITILFSLPIYVQCIKIIRYYDEMLSNANSDSQARLQSILEKAIFEILHTIAKSDYTTSKRIAKSYKMILFYYSLLLVASTKQLQSEINALIPMKGNSNYFDISLRNRKVQIQHILRRDDNLHRLYLMCIQNICSLGITKLNTLQKNEHLSSATKELTINNQERRVYIKIIGLMVHEIVHSGLGVVIGMRSSIAYTKLTEAITKLQSTLNDKSV